MHVWNTVIDGNGGRRSLEESDGGGLKDLGDALDPERTLGLVLDAELDGLLVTYGVSGPVIISYRLTLLVHGEDALISLLLRDDGNVGHRDDLRGRSALLGRETVNRLRLSHERAEEKGVLVSLR